MNAIAHQAAAERLGEGGYYFENVHDNVIADPDYMAIHQAAVPEAFTEVAEFDLSDKVAQAYAKQVANWFQNWDSPIVSLGEKGDLPGILVALDEDLELYQRNDKDTTRGPGQETFDFLQRISEKKLKDAYKLGIWAPKTRVEVGGIVLEPRSEVDSQVKAVDFKKFQNWFLEHYVQYLVHKAPKIWQRSSERGSEKARFIQSIKNNFRNGVQGFMKVGI